MIHEWPPRKPWQPRRPVEVLVMWSQCGACVHSFGAEHEQLCKETAALATDPVNGYGVQRTCCCWTSLRHKLIIPCKRDGCNLTCCCNYKKYLNCIPLHPGRRLLALAGLSMLSEPSGSCIASDAAASLCRAFQRHLHERSTATGLKQGSC